MAEKEPSKRTEDGANRDAKGRFGKGNTASRGRPALPPEARDWATKDMADLHEMAEDEAVPVKLRADIKRWMVEMVYGKAAQAVDVDGSIENTGTTTVKFEGVLDEWSK